MIRPDAKYYDLVLVNTPGKDYSKFHRQEDRVPLAPIGLGYLASYLDKQGWQVGLYDAEYHKKTITELKADLIVCNTDYIGFNAMSENIHLVAKVARELSQKTIIGGIHPTLAPEETLLKYPFFHALVYGEGEIPLSQILDGIPLKDIPGVVFNDNCEIKVNPRSSLHSLDDFPVINRKFFENFPRFNLITSRGCPHNCSFCASPVLCNRVVRFVPMSKVMEEMISGFEAGYRNFHFLDDQFLINEARAIEFLSALKDTGLYGKITWRGMIRADTVVRMRNQILIELKRSGGDILALGIESGCQRILKMIHKNSSNDIAKLAIKKLSNLEFIVKAFFMLGFLNETYEEMLETKQLILELGDLGLDYFVINILRPYPGTEVYYRLMGQGYNPEEIFFEEETEEDAEIKTEYVRSYYDRLNRKVRISEVAEDKIRELIKEVIKEFENKFRQ